MSDIDLMFGINACTDLTKLERIFLAGDSTHTYLDHQSVFSRLLRTGNLNTITLTEQIRVDVEIKGIKGNNQIINVPDFKTKGMTITKTESGKPVINNLAEAEYAVALYMYLRLYSGI